jgi:hypothetical protein
VLSLGTGDPSLLNLPAVKSAVQSVGYALPAKIRGPIQDGPFENRQLAETNSRPENAFPALFS